MLSPASCSDTLKASLNAGSETWSFVLLVIDSTPTFAALAVGPPVRSASVFTSVNPNGVANVVSGSVILSSDTTFIVIAAGLLSSVVVVTVYESGNADEMAGPLCTYLMSSLQSEVTARVGLLSDAAHASAAGRSMNQPSVSTRSFTLSHDPGPGSLTTTIVR